MSRTVWGVFGFDLRAEEKKVFQERQGEKYLYHDRAGHVPYLGILRHD